MKCTSTSVLFKPQSKPLSPAGASGAHSGGVDLLVGVRHDVPAVGIARMPADDSTVLIMSKSRHQILLYTLKQICAGKTLAVRRVCKVLPKAPGMSPLLCAKVVPATKYNTRIGTWIYLGGQYIVSVDGSRADDGLCMMALLCSCFGCPALYLRRQLSGCEARTLDQQASPMAVVVRQ